MPADRPLSHGILAVMPSGQQLQHGMRMLVTPNRSGVMELEGKHMGRGHGTRPASRSRVKFSVQVWSA